MFRRIRITLLLVTLLVSVTSAGMQIRSRTAPQSKAHSWSISLRYRTTAELPRPMRLARAARQQLGLSPQRINCRKHRTDLRELAIHVGDL